MTDRERSSGESHRRRHEERGEKDEEDRHRSSRHREHRDDRERDDGDRRHRHSEKDVERRRERKRDETSEERRERKRSRRRDKDRDGGRGMEVVDDDEAAEEDMWVEKGVEEHAIQSIPSSLSLPLTSHASQSSSARLPGPTSAGSKPLERDAWMLDPSAPAIPSGLTSVSVSRQEKAGRSDIPHSATLPSSSSTTSGGMIRSKPLTAESTQEQENAQEPDFFSSLGTEVKRTRPDDRLAALQAASAAKAASLELVKPDSTSHPLSDPVTPAASDSLSAPGQGQGQKYGAPGHQWRMMKLRRLTEQAAEEGRNVEDVAVERYGSIEAYEEALGEKRWLDEREQRRRSGPMGASGASSRGASVAASSASGRAGQSDGMRTPGEVGSAAATGGRRYMFTNPTDDPSAPSSFSRSGSRNASFRRPGERDRDNTSALDTPTGPPPQSAGGTSRLDQLRGGLGPSSVSGGSGHSSPGAHTPSGARGSGMGKTTPIPSVFTPTNLVRRQNSGFPFDTAPTLAGGVAGAAESNDPSAASSGQPSLNGSTTSRPPLSTEALNRLQAKVLRAKLMDDPDAAELEEEYEMERDRADQAQEAGMWPAGGGAGGVNGMGRVDSGVNDQGVRVETQVLPTLDGRGQLYDVGRSTSSDPDRAAGTGADGRPLPGNKRKKPEKFETRDKQGNLLRYNADDDEHSLGELVRQERFGGGAADQKDMDAEMVRAIATDGGFKNDTEYMDDNADRLARRKMKSDAMKRAFAINDFARTKKALDTCPFCYQDDRPPLTAIVALGRRTYMCCTQMEELAPGHCLIVPLQHHLASLEMEDDDWDEVRNFMKCLMRMHAANNCGVLFFETVLSFKQQRHTFIEAVPLPFSVFQDAPAYFRESILVAESEWSTHRKLIDFGARAGGFRRAMVPNLPYFMVQWDYKGEKGYGHVIEGTGEMKQFEGEEEGMGRGYGEDGERGMGSGDFPKWFAAEIIGNLLGLEPRRWMKPRRMDTALNKERARELGEKFQPYNWTVELQREDGLRE